MASKDTIEELLLSDDLAPNDGEPFQPDTEEPDEELQEEMEQERAVIASALPIWEDLTKWLDDGILAADSVEQVHKTVELYKCGLENALIAHDIVRKLIEAKRIELDSLHDTIQKS